MLRKTWIALVGAMALPLLAVAQGQGPAYEYRDDRGSMYGDEAGEPGAGTYGEYRASDAQAAPPIDVSVEMATPGATVSFETFREGLAPHGEWVTVSSYGRVWRPLRVAAGWRPYYYGRWEWTDEGWLWVSDEPWGWAAYHYGRWAYDGSYGWVWIPGYQWAPAWVTWRYSPDYIGWAPLGPGFSVYVTAYPALFNWWTFVPCRSFVGHPVHSVAYAGSHVPGIFHGTRPAPPRAMMAGGPAPAWGGPARPFVEQRIGQRIAPVRVLPVSSAAAAVAPPRGGQGVVPVYRPEVRPAPARPGTSAPGAGYRSGAPTPGGAQGGAPPRAAAVPAPAPAPGYRQAPAGNQGWRSGPGPAPAYRPPAAPRQETGTPRLQQAPPAQQIQQAPPAQRFQQAPPAQRFQQAPPAARPQQAPPAARPRQDPPASRGPSYAPPSRGPSYAPPSRAPAYAAPAGPSRAVRQEGSLTRGSAAPRPPGQPGGGQGGHRGGNAAPARHR